MYASVLDVGRCADLVPVFFDVGCEALCRCSHTFKISGQDARPLPSFAVGVSAGDVTSVWAAVEEV